jgi:hypothetical protein
MLHPRARARSINAGSDAKWMTSAWVWIVIHRQRMCKAWSR